jgi:hypothetical protein
MRKIIKASIPVMALVALLWVPMSVSAKPSGDHGNSKKGSGGEVTYEQTGLAYDSTMIVLSEMSNNEGEGNGVSADELNADVTLTVVGTMLTMEVENTSNALSSMDFDISAINFNFNPADVSNVQLIMAPDSDAGWIKSNRRADRMIGGFGSFGVAVKALPDLTYGEVGMNPDLIGPGETGVFVFSFDCAGACDASDFDLENGASKAVAAKFINGGGSGGVSAFGASGASNN